VATAEPGAKTNPKVLEIVSPHLVPWYRRLDSSDPLRSWLFPAIADHFVVTKDYTSLVRFLDEEMRLGPPPLASPYLRIASVRLTASGGGAPADMIRSLGFPPRPGGDFPPIIFQVLEGRGELISTSASTQVSSRNLKIPPEVLEPLLPEVKDPVLRMLLATRSDSRKLVADCIPALEAIEKPSLTAVLLLSGWMETRGDEKEAAAILLKAPSPANQADQWRLDGARVSGGLEAVAATEGRKVDESNPVVKAAREAALRLTKAQMLYDSRRQKIPRTSQTSSGGIARVVKGIFTLNQSLIDALKTLGLKDEAIRYAATYSPAGPGETSRLKPPPKVKKPAPRLPANP
jgi:hypothetical protein